MKRGNGKKPGSGERGVLRPGKEEEVVWWLVSARDARGTSARRAQ
jgi:hypothetical protein